MEKRKRCYNSGPISGLPIETARINFERADMLIADTLNMTPINPMKHSCGIPVHAPWIVHMIKDIILLLTCSNVYFQLGWERSRGARWEFNVAAFTGKSIWTACDGSIRKHT